MTPDSYIRVPRYRRTYPGWPTNATSESNVKSIDGPRREVFQKEERFSSFLNFGEKKGNSMFDVTNADSLLLSWCVALSLFLMT